MELNAKITEELQKYTAAKDDGGRNAAKEQLQNALSELFDIRQKDREQEIKQIEERVAHLRDTLKKRESMRQDLIGHHLTTLIQDAEGLGWGTEGGPGPRALFDAGNNSGGRMIYRAGQTQQKLPPALYQRPDAPTLEPR